MCVRVYVCMCVCVCGVCERARVHHRVEPLSVCEGVEDARDVLQLDVNRGALLAVAPRH